MNEFLAQIFAVIHQIPHGKVSTYGDIAKFAGYPGYARQVGAALKKLPQGSKLPWHRVINSQGKISLQGNDLSRQMAELRQEGVLVAEGGKVALRQYRWQPGQD
ncbi:MGMT family protein [Vibrio sp. FNV 38]|nr:MGMT family protein [Vibrio sp. FNV 38]